MCFCLHSVSSDIFNSENLLLGFSPRAQNTNKPLKFRLQRPYLQIQLKNISAKSESILPPWYFQKKFIKKESGMKSKVENEFYIYGFLDALLKSCVLQESVNKPYFVNKQVELIQNHQFCKKKIKRWQYVCYIKC